MRSKVLAVSNVFSTIYATVLLWVFGEGIMASGDIMDAMGILSDISSVFSDYVVVIYIIAILLICHIGLFTLGAILGWLGFATKKSASAKLAAVCYLIGTICFPVYIVFGLPITILGFIGAGKQKNLNSEVLG